MAGAFEEQVALFRLYQELRDDLMNLLTDEALVYQPGGAAPTLGSLCREIGETEQSYLESFATLRQDFSYRHPDPAIDHSVARLTAWYAELDAALASTLGALTPEALDNDVIDRGGGFEVSLPLQLEIYKEALLIFYGKASVYVKALGMEVPGRWQRWIG